MTESLMRARFPPGKQKGFLLQVKFRLKTSWNKIAQSLQISTRTLTDWRREKFLMPIETVRRLSKISKLPLPSNIEFIERYWYTKKGGTIGGPAVLKKYGRIGGNPEYRKKKWYEWWESLPKNDRNRFLTIPKPFTKPGRSRQLAEFFGIMMGDGSISHSQINISLHHLDDLAFSKFVIGLTKKLFHIQPSIYHRPRISIRNIVISRVGLVQYLMSLGLVQGNKIKQNFDIPPWIKEKKAYRIACLRGLIDTDGCIITHNYRVNGKMYTYKKLAFTSASKPLRTSVHSILKSLGFNPRFAQSRDVRLESQKDIKRYTKLIGSHNPKHLRKLPL